MNAQKWAHIDRNKIMSSSSHHNPLDLHDFIKILELGVLPFENCF